MYQNLDKHGEKKAHFPTARFDLKEFFAWRNWQAESIVKTMYYVHMVMAVVYMVSYIVAYTIDWGVGGFFLGLLVGFLVMVVMIMYARVFCEVILSVFSMRDNIEKLANAHQPALQYQQPPQPQPQVQAYGSPIVQFPTYHQPAPVASASPAQHYESL